MIHGSRRLERAGHTVIGYDARGHGESDPAPPDGGYGYPELVDDLETVIEDRVGGGRFLLAGHSMGAHTAVAFALRHPRRLAGLVVIGPAYDGAITPDSLRYWDGLAAALERGRHRRLRRLHRPRPGASIRPGATRSCASPANGWNATAIPRPWSAALREVPRSRPFDDLAELERLEVPALVVASHDAADPGHPYAVAEAYAARTAAGHDSSARPRGNRRSPGRAGGSRARLRLSTESCNSVPAMKAPAEGTLRGIATFLATFGIGVATYIAIADSGGGSPVCIAGGHGCQTVAESSYSHLFGVNIAIFGIAGYVVLLACALLRGDALPHDRLPRLAGRASATAST